MTNEGSNTETLAPVESHLFEVFYEVSLSVLLGLQKYFMTVKVLKEVVLGIITWV